MNNYKILTLGASGSGKTVFLASMFRALSTQRKHGFYIDVENDKERKILNRVYTNLIAGGIWPKGTQYAEISEWSYTCRVKNTELDNFAVSRFVYFDYAGGRFTDMDENDIELQTIIKKADTILGLLDGRKILDLMTQKNQTSVNSFIKRDLSSIIKWMTACPVPIHFVISKWDLIENKFSLQQIRDRLLEIPELQSLIRQRNKRGYPVRLIPVSSIGSDFATLQADGSMKKNPGSIPQPFQLEVPISCVLPDHFKAEINSIAQQQEEQGKSDKHLNLLQGFFKGINKVTSTATLVGEVGVEALFLLGGPEGLLARVAVGMTKPIISKLVANSIENPVTKFQNYTQEMWETLEKAREDAITKVKNQETALEHAVESFLHIQNELIFHFPESELFLD